MGPYATDLRIPCPIGYRIDTEKVRARIHDLVQIVAANAGRLDRQAIRQTGAAAAQIGYLTRLQEQALARNGHSHASGG